MNEPVQPFAPGVGACPAGHQIGSPWAMASAEACVASGCNSPSAFRTVTVVFSGTVSRLTVSDLQGRDPLEQLPRPVLRLQHQTHHITSYRNRSLRGGCFIGSNTGGLRSCCFLGSEQSAVWATGVRGGCFLGSDGASGSGIPCLTCPWNPLKYIRCCLFLWALHLLYPHLHTQLSDRTALKTKTAMNGR